MRSKALAGIVFLIAVAGGGGGAVPAAAGIAGDFDGHLAIGYSKLFATHAPGGSMSFAGGVDHALAGPFRLGVDVGFHLLGGRSEVRGSLVANIDDSAFEADLLAHWTPSWPGPVGRISFGPALLAPRAELSSSGGGAAFSDLAVEKVTGGLAVEVTLIQRSPAPVRVGLQLGARMAFMQPENWTIATARVAFHY